MRSASETEPYEQSYGLFCQMLPDPDADQAPPGFFVWFNTLDQLLEGLSPFCIYWNANANHAATPRRIRAAVRRCIKEYLTGTTISDLIFRLNNLLHPAGLNLQWMGPFSDLLFSNSEIPVKTRRFCRRTLADMEVHAVDPLNDAPLESEYLSTFIECLHDFGPDGQGLS